MKNDIRKDIRKDMKAAAAVLALSLTMIFAAFGSGGTQAAFAESESGYSKLAESYEGKTVILQTNDVHGAIEGYQYVAGLKEELEDRGADVILVDCGDYAQGSLYVGEYSGESAVGLMNACGYDYATLGNHEFDYGVAQMKKNVSDGTFKTICADITDNDTGKCLYDGSVLYEDDDSDLSIGFFGMDTPETQTKALPSYTDGLSFPAQDKIYTEVAQGEIDSLREDGADLVVCLSHFGVNDGSAPYRSYDLYAETADDDGNATIDFILDGHSHTVMEEGKNGEPIMSTGTKLCNIGVLVIDEETETIEDNFLYGLRATESDNFYGDLPSDEAVADATQGYIDALDDAYKEVVASTEVALNGNKDTVDGVRGNRTGETNMGDLVTDATLWYVNSRSEIPDTDAAHTVAVFNGGSIRAGISAGDVTKKDLYDVLPFNNTIVAVYVKGSELLEALEASTYCTPDVCGGFPQVSGIKYVIDETKKYDAAEETYPGSTYYGPATINRVTITEVNGEAFDKDATYTVITNNFCAEGGDTYYAFASASKQFDTGITPLAALTAYVKDGLGGVIGEDYAEPDGRVTYKTVKDIAPQNGIPLIVINVDEQELTEEDGVQYGSIADMNGSEHHSVRCHGTVEIKLPDGYSGGLGESVLKTNEEGTLDLSYIRGRGNSTWTAGSKKPYKLKFSKKQDLFGIGSNKEWALMANAYDPTLMKNRFTGWLGDKMGMEFTPRNIPVDVVMVGSQSGVSYLGSYSLSELVGVGESRLEIDELDSSVTAKTGDPNITGGYLMSIYTDAQNSDDPKSTVFSTTGGIDLINRVPEYDDTETALTEGEEAQRTYIRKYVQEVEDMITEADTIGRVTHARIEKKLDLQSAADYWLIQEFSMNGDAYKTSSTYFYKKRDGKLYFGPLWDFDLAWGDLILDEEDASNYDPYVDSFNNTDMLWLDDLRAKDPEFQKLIQDRWLVLDEYLEELTEDGGIIDQYAAEVSASEADDRDIWGEEINRSENYEQTIANQKKWIDKRRAWFNKHMDTDLGKVYCTAVFEADGAVVESSTVRRGTYFDEHELPEAPEKSGYVFTGWYDSESGESAANCIVSEDTTFEAIYIAEKDAVAPTALFFLYDEAWMSVDDDGYFYNSEEVAPENASSKVISWSISDESIASIVNGSGIKALATGDVTVTGTLYNGVSGSYTLHIYDPKETPAQAMTGMETSPVTVTEGGYAKAAFSMLPAGVPIEEYYISYESSNEDVAEVSYNGVIKGISPGTATIKITVEVSGGPDVTAECKVTVTKAETVRKANTLKAKAKTVKVKKRTLRKKGKATVKRSKAIKVTGAKGTVTYAKVAAGRSKVTKKQNKKYGKYFKVNKKTGKITVKKGLKRGTYRLKIKVKAAGNSAYKPGTKTVTVKIKVR